MNSLQLSNTLSLLRWLATMMFVIRYLMSFLFVRYDKVEIFSILTKFLYFVILFWYQAVIIFFVKKFK